MTEQQDDAAERVAAYLDAWSQHPHPTTRDCQEINRSKA